MWLLTWSGGGHAGRHHSTTKPLSPKKAALAPDQPAWVSVPALPLLTTGEKERTSLGLRYFVTQTGMIRVPAS